ncbi:Spo0E family sporulation regulatory protein-aspartic acid phosphatase [Bacillus mycoides]|uniref:Spo0E family sporulation regulatory protein-aspartic acid phosphatase n=1 Tax=Bacillus mycoides TaxID=1405 RepID=UPI003D07BB5A
MSKLPYGQKQITEKKQELLLLLQQYSCTHPIVIAKSQELDRLIYLFMHQNASQSSCTSMKKRMT